jgi:hypothetical protein
MRSDFFALFLSLVFITTVNAIELESSGPIIVSEQLPLSTDGAKKDFEYSQNFEQLYRHLPNMHSTKGSNRTKFLQIRGIGERSEFTPLLKRSVGVKVDGIDYTDYPQAFDTFGTSDKEIHYGPQVDGALAGKLVFKDAGFKNKPVAKAQLLYSSFNQTEQKAHLKTSNKSFIPTSITVAKIDSDGEHKNSYLGRKDTNGRDEFYLRLKSEKQLTSAISAQYKLHHTHQNNGYDAFIQNNSFTTETDKPGRDDLDRGAHQLALNIERENSIHTIKADYIWANSDYAYDEDWGNNTKWLALDGYNSTYNYNREFLRKRNRYGATYEVATDSMDLSLSYRTIRDNHTERGFKNDLENSLTISQIEDSSAAITAAKSWELSPNLGLNVSGGFEHSTLKMKNNFLFDKTQNENLVRLKTTLTSKYGYLSLAKGAKPGGFNTESALTDDRKSYQAENLYSLDLGTSYEVKKYFLKHHINVFVMQRDDVQVKTSYQSDPTDPSKFTFYTDNGTKALVYGIEQNLTLNPVHWFELTTKLGLLQSSYEDFNYGEKNLRNREMANSPNYQFSLTASTKLTKGWSFTANYFQQDNFYFSNSHDQMGHGHRLTDLALQWTLKKTKLDFFVNNVFDEDYQTRGFFFGNQPPNWADELYTQRGAGRSFGTRVTHHF